MHVDLFQMYIFNTMYGNQFVQIQYQRPGSGTCGVKVKMWYPGQVLAQVGKVLKYDQVPVPHACMYLNVLLVVPSRRC